MYASSLRLFPSNRVESAAGENVAFTRYRFSSCLCTNQSSFHSSGPPALPTQLQYHCTAIGKCTTPHLTPLVSAIHSRISAMAISCKGQERTHPPSHMPYLF